MLETLEVRLKQCQDGHLGYIEFLEFLLEDELQRRANKKLEIRVNQARFEEVKTLETFNFEFNPKIPSWQIMDLASCRFIERKEWALFIGPVGVGKSHLIQALGHQACRQGYRVLFSRASRLFTDLGGGHADGTWENRLTRYLKPDLLLIDDFAMKELTLTFPVPPWWSICLKTRWVNNLKSDIFNIFVPTKYLVNIRHFETSSQN
jgi:DNA replication protein DnaC